MSRRTRTQSRLHLGLVLPGLCLFSGMAGALEPMRLTRTDGSTHCPQWSPNGKWLAYVKCRSDYRFGDIWRVSPMGGEEVQLTDTRCRREHLRWSPSGMWICYAAHDIVYRRQGNGIG